MTLCLLFTGAGTPAVTLPFLQTQTLGGQASVTTGGGQTTTNTQGGQPTISTRGPSA